MNRQLAFVSSAIVTVFLVLAGCNWQITPQPSPPSLAALGLRCADCHATFASKMQGGVHAGLQTQCLQCHPNAREHQDGPDAVRAAIDFSLEACATCHGRQYDSYVNDDMIRAGRYGGSIITSKYDEFPRYQYLMGGHGFTIQYGEERAHKWILRDHVDTGRRQTTTCLQCKSTPVAYYWNESRRGQLQYAKSQTWADVVQRLRDEQPDTVDYGAGCTHCHDPHTGGFRLIRKGVIEGILARGTDPYTPALNVIPADAGDLSAKLNERGPDGKLTPQARRLAGTLTCAQCHIEYVCGAGADRLTTGEIRDDVPWRKLADIEAYYQGKFGNQQDWKHSVTGLTGVKPQHPETETFWNSHHHEAGLSCAECHMERRTAPDGKPFTSHWLTSPLKHESSSCNRCHDPRQQIHSVMLAVQDSVYSEARVVEEALNALLQRIEAAAAGGMVAPDALAQAKALYMRGLTWWEWTAVSENSMGIHNWTETRNNFAVAADFVQQANALLP